MTTENDPPADDAAGDSAGDAPVGAAPADESTPPPAADEPTAAPPDEPPVVEPLAIEAGVDREREAVLTRGILPFALPIASVLVLGVFVINLSRAFLAGGSDGALIIGVVAILTIMGIAAFLSAAPRIRSSSMVMVVSSVLILVVSAGLISLGPSEEKKEGAGAAYQPPKGPAVATVEVDALPALKFQAKNFDTQAGINAIKYVDKGGTHTLAFDEPQFTGFELKVPQGPTTGKVLLKPGKYTIYCTIPGHRAAGMEATITVQ